VNPSSTSNSKGAYRAGLIALCLVVGFLVLIAHRVGLGHLRYLGVDKSKVGLVIDQVEAFGSVRPPNRSHVLLFGDSTHRARGHGTQTLAERTKEALAAQKGVPENTMVEGVYHLRFDMGHFYMLASHLIYTKPVAVVVPLNLFTFSEDWFEHNGSVTFAYLSGMMSLSEFLKDGNLVANYLNVSFSSLVGYQLIFKMGLEDTFFVVRGLRKYLRTRIRSVGLSILQGEKFVEVGVEEVPITNYLAKLNIGEGAWSVIFAKKLHELCVKNNVPLLFYISPVDWASLSGNVQETRAALRELQKNLEVEGLLILNLADYLRHEQFEDMLHFNDAAGVQVASLLATRLQEMIAPK
jgi:hypothetical protein